MKKAGLLLSVCTFSVFASATTLAQSLDTSSWKLPNEFYVKGGIKSPAEFDLNQAIKSLDKLNLEEFEALPKSKIELESAAKDFVRTNASELGLSDSAASFELKSVRSSLTGTFVEYEQRLNGTLIIGSQLGVTLDAKGTVSSVVKNLIAVPTNKAGSLPREPKLSSEEAMEKVVADLKPSGSILEAPTTTQAYLARGEGLTLVYVVRLAVQEPFGYWEYRVDATSGEIVEKFDRRVQEKKRSSADADNPAAKSTLEQLNTKQILEYTAKTVVTSVTGQKANSSGLVFDPNPVTTLMNPTLSDFADGTQFEQAYKKVQLEDITQIDGSFHLSGPFVRIEDFEPGDGDQRLPPSTSNGEWTATRGVNAFNDVMTYYFISHSLKYLKQLGYSSDKDLFPNGIAADSDGLRGQDQSYYLSDSDRIAFGHGCVDDNEDTDVILHELGHAIHYHVNPSWGGGDSGAIGEGFGDYWAVSYRMKLSNGLGPDNGKVFPWDGVADTGCWPGRRSDVAHAIYDHSIRFEAHVLMGTPPNTFQTDELWSTPLVGALHDIRAANGKIEDADKIVLEGMFDIGSNFTMRTLAVNTVKKAQELYPDKNYAQIFEARFKAHGIIP